MNLATLNLARASARQRELAVWVAIGASRSRILSQLLLESLLVSAGGAALAVPVALGSGRVLVAFLETSANPTSLDLRADWRMMVSVAAIAGLSAVFFGLLPALRVSSVDPIAALRQAARGLTLDRRRARAQRAFVVAQIAISLVPRTRRRRTKSSAWSGTRSTRTCERRTAGVTPRAGRWPVRTWRFAGTDRLPTAEVSPFPSPGLLCPDTRPAVAVQLLHIGTMRP